MLSLTACEASTLLDNEVYAEDIQPVTSVKIVDETKPQQPAETAVAKNDAEMLVAETAATQSGPMKEGSVKAVPVETVEEEKVVAETVVAEADAEVEEKTDLTAVPMAEKTAQERAAEIKNQLMADLKQAEAEKASLLNEEVSKAESDVNAVVTKVEEETTSFVSGSGEVVTSTSTETIVEKPVQISKVTEEDIPLKTPEEIAAEQQAQQAAETTQKPVEPVIVAPRWTTTPSQEQATSLLSRLEREKQEREKIMPTEYGQAKDELAEIDRVMGLAEEVTGTPSPANAVTPAPVDVKSLYRVTKTSGQPQDLAAAMPDMNGNVDDMRAGASNDMRAGALRAEDINDSDMDALMKLPTATQTVSTKSQPILLSPDNLSLLPNTQTANRVSDLREKQDTVGSIGLTPSSQARVDAQALNDASQLVMEENTLGRNDYVMPTMNAIDRPLNDTLNDDGVIVVEGAGVPEMTKDMKPSLQAKPSATPVYEEPVYEASAPTADLPKQATGQVDPMQVGMNPLPDFGGLPSDPAYNQATGRPMPVSAHTGRSAVKKPTAEQAVAAQGQVVQRNVMPEPVSAPAPQPLAYQQPAIQQPVVQQPVVQQQRQKPVRIVVQPQYYVVPAPQQPAVQQQVAAAPAPKMAPQPVANASAQFGSLPAYRRPVMRRNTVQNVVIQGTPEQKQAAMDNVQKTAEELAKIDFNLKSVQGSGTTTGAEPFKK